MKPTQALARALCIALSLSAAALATLPAHAQSAPPPNFDQVFAAPDDPALNLEYARAEAKAGNLLSAAAALERLLLAQPNWHAARLFYAGVLYRLDDLRGANQQLALLDRAAITPAQRKDVDQYRGLIAQRLRR